ncbi:MAG: type II toxin-antitoxin system VapC family toxin [Betaproteobacteria bacterium]|nr:type II toxin-antitoxin system VapC family toxin [Betaproteobacteria bacterium]
MRLLLDTCIVYDWLMGTVADEKVADLIQTTGAMASALAVWEMAIKHALGKMPLPASASIVADIESQGFEWLYVSPAHAEHVLHLPAVHKDPFDRLLIAQAFVEGMQIVTYDEVFVPYGVPVLLARKAQG